MAPDDAGPAIPRLLAMMWGRENGARRGPKPALTLDQIAAAGVAVADAEGLGAVSMSRVARELGFTTMSLYRYVNSRDDLEIAMLDHAYGPVVLPARDPAPGADPDHSWRPRLEDWATALRGGLLTHSWILQIPITEPPLGPNTTRWTEAGLAALAGTSLSGQAKLSSLLLVDVYTRGQTQLALSLSGAASGTPGDLYGPRLAALIDGEGFPHLRAAILTGALEDDAGDFGEEEFGFGLRTVLDGIQAGIDRAAAS